ncbi:MAG: prolipoprotein diacylglyceryl transferase [Bacteroidota bacterium]
MLGYIVWDVEPEVFRLGFLAPRWYGLLFAAAFLLGYYFVRWMFRKEDQPEAWLDNLLLYMIAGTVIGARLGHVLFYDPAYYLSNPLEIPMIWKGGLASHGGGLGMTVALYLFARKVKKKPLIWFTDRLCLPTAIGAAMVRLGNLFNHEIVGRPTDSSLGFVFTHCHLDRYLQPLTHDPALMEAYQLYGGHVPRFPTQLLEALCYLLTGIAIFVVYQRANYRPKPGLMIGVFLFMTFVARFFIEFLKENQVAFEDGLPLNMGQILSIPFVFIGLYLIFRKNPSLSPNHNS